MKVWEGGLLLAITLGLALVCGASVSPPSVDSGADVSARDHQLSSGAVHDSNFSAMPRVAARNSCEAVHPPEALTTPDPLLDTPSSTRVMVSFIVGTDGRVHSPLIMEGLGPAEDRIVLDAVRSWRYRPATCNGVPTEAEGKIAFSSR
jgi:outer membrane biosynthesis protein TonB